MKVFYVTQWSNDERGFFPGPAKKINEQVKVFETYGFDTELINNNLKMHNSKSGIARRIITGIYTRLPFTEALKTNDYQIVKVPNISRVINADIIYIRFWWGDYKFKRCIVKLRRQNPEALIFLEFPDYPYRGKETGISSLHLLLKDRNCSRVYKKNIDYVVTLTRIKKVYGVPALHMYNGINVENISIKDPSQWTPNIVNLGFVAFAQHAHGIDRLIEGFRRYYNHNKNAKHIILHIAGGGPVYNSLVELTNKYGLNEYIKFYGYIYGEQLDLFYNKIDIGVDYLAPHRDGISVSSSLKTREYMAKGIPILTGAYLDICEDQNADFCLKIESNEKPISVDEIIAFSNYIYRNGPNQVIQKIRKFAEEYIDIKKTMSFIMDLSMRK